MIRVDTRRKLVIIAVVGKIGNPLWTESAPLDTGWLLATDSHLEESGAESIA
jgi:hypothetical protein